MTSAKCLAVGGNFTNNRYYSTLKGTTGLWSLPVSTTVGGTNGGPWHLNAVSCVAGGNCYVAGGISTTQRITARFVSSGDTSWTITRQDSSTTATGQLNGIHCPTNDICYAVGRGGVITKTTNASTSGTWTDQTSGVTKNLRGIHCVDASTCWAVGNGGAPAGTTSAILKTTDGGTNWVSQDLAAFSDSLYSVRFSDANTGVIVGGNGSVLRTTNGGTNWVLNGFHANWLMQRTDHITLPPQPAALELGITIRLQLG